LNSFISYRQSYSHHPTKKPRYGGPASNGFRDGGRVSEERLGLISAGDIDEDGDAVIEMDLLPPRWLDIQDEVTEHLAEIAKQTRKLDQLHQKHVLPGFDDEEVKKREEREIEQLTQNITRAFQRCQQAIKRIEMMVREAKQQGSINQGEEVMAQNLKISLATRVGEVSAMFRKKQAAYLKSELWPDPCCSPHCADIATRTPRPRRLCLALPLRNSRPEPLQRSRTPRI
jgi:syntaxin 16